MNVVIRQFHDGCELLDVDINVADCVADGIATTELSFSVQQQRMGCSLINSQRISPLAPHGSGNAGSFVPRMDKNGIAVTVMVTKPPHAAAAG